MRAPAETVARARCLRREMTLPEVLLWRLVRRKAAEGLRFRRQHPLSRCVLDFYCPSARLAVEIDGLAHDMGDNPARDARRDAWLASQGIRVLRIRAIDVLDEDSREGVLRLILQVARHEPPPPPAAAPPP
jgi:very-short-patch-repair endonuclease